MEIYNFSSSEAYDYDGWCYGMEIENIIFHIKTESFFKKYY